MRLEAAMKELADAFEAVWQAIKEVFENTLAWLLETLAKILKPKGENYYDTIGENKIIELGDGSTALRELERATEENYRNLLW